MLNRGEMDALAKIIKKLFHDPYGKNQKFDDDDFTYIVKKAGFGHLLKEEEFKNEGN